MTWYAPRGTLMVEVMEMTRQERINMVVQALQAAGIEPQVEKVPGLGTRIKPRAYILTPNALGEYRWVCEVWDNRIEVADLGAPRGRRRATVEEVVALALERAGKGVR